MTKEKISSLKISPEGAVSQYKNKPYGLFLSPYNTSRKVAEFIRGCLLVTFKNRDTSSELV